MVNIRLEFKPAFTVIGKKTWISKVDDFHDFWSQCHTDGTVNKLKSICGDMGTVTKSNIFGVSRVEKDPQNRDFYFYIATEIEDASINQHNDYDRDFETFTIDESLWAVFEASGEVLNALFEAEMFAFKDWLPSSEYKHAYAPELEVYPAKDQNKVEFWLPMVKK